MSSTHGTWGKRDRIFEWSGGLVTMLYLEPKQRCSYHRHQHSYNLFYVVSGELGVKTDKGYTTKLLPQQVPFVVEPFVQHEFQTYEEPTTLLEIAYVEYDVNDIVRESLGGPLDEQA